MRENTHADVGQTSASGAGEGRSERVNDQLGSQHLILRDKEWAGLLTPDADKTARQEQLGEIKTL